MNSDVKKQRWKLFGRQKGRCYYCGCDMVLMWKASPNFRPANLATLEHLNDRNRGPRPNVPGEYTHVLSCNRCNNEKGKLSQTSMPIEELWRKCHHRTGGVPLPPPLEGLA